MLISLEPSKMYVTPAGVIYKTNADGVVDVNDEAAAKFLMENAGGKELTKRQESAALEEKRLEK